MAGCEGSLPEEGLGGLPEDGLFSWGAAGGVVTIHGLDLALERVVEGVVVGVRWQLLSSAAGGIVCFHQLPVWIQRVCNRERRGGGGGGGPVLVNGGLMVRQKWDDATLGSYL